MKRVTLFADLRVYFIGIGGISMSGLAQMLISFGAKVSGSDISKNHEIERLESLGVKINIGHDASNITSDIDLVVYTLAISQDNPELLRAYSLGIETITRAELLGEISRNYTHTIAVSGTHGKTTTTAMLGEIFTNAGLNPTIHLGGESLNLKGNTIIGDRDYFLVEACEYGNSFRYISSDTAVITNIEADHLDYYKSMEEIRGAFKDFTSNANRLVVDNTVNIHHEEKSIIGSDWVVGDISFEDMGYDYSVYYRGEFYGDFRLNILGLHNVKNSLFAISVAHIYGINVDIIKNALLAFKGVERRYESIGHISGIPIIIDYAHHPTEIASSIEGLRGIYPNILVVFQPHTYSRTLSLFDDFVRVLSGIDSLILYATYPAREEYIEGGGADDLNRVLPQSEYIDSFPPLVDKLSSELKERACDMVLVLGAGDLAIKLKDYLNAK